MGRHHFRRARYAAACLALVVYSACVVLCPSRVDTIENEEDRYVRAQMAQSHTPGVSVGVVRHGKVVLTKGYGRANVELSVPATTDTVYELLSVSKQFTAAAVLLLVEEDKVSLEGAISKYLPDTPVAWKDVTVHHLLTHTSGIMDYTDIPRFSKGCARTPRRKR